MKGTETSTSFITTIGIFVYQVCNSEAEEAFKRKVVRKLVLLNPLTYFHKSYANSFIVSSSLHIGP